MNRQEWIDRLATGGDKPHTRGVIYNKQEVDQIFRTGSRITSVCYTHPITNKEYEFFTNNHIFGYPSLGESFCPCSLTIPGECVPREGCEDGIMNSFDKYAAVHNNTDFYIWSIDELLDLLAGLGRVEGEGYDGNCTVESLIKEILDPDNKYKKTKQGVTRHLGMTSNNLMVDLKCMFLLGSACIEGTIGDSAVKIYSTSNHALRYYLNDTQENIEKMDIQGTYSCVPAQWKEFVEHLNKTAEEAME